ncbi:MAG: nucleotide exchange factor GrpE [Oscillospiraceae bacterium]|jgi:molecular chaperone GrpE|nr:nucleotide exchange factor GrpE [Oscillospiraceae bacterium]
MSKTKNTQEPEIQEDDVREYEDALLNDDSEADEAEFLALIAEEKEKYLRLYAEYENFRRRSKQERESLFSAVTAQTAGSFLEVYDSLEAAVKVECADASYKKGVELTLEKLKAVFSSLGIEEISAVGEKFDPELHSAVTSVSDEEKDDGEIVQQFQAGFRLGGTVLRHAIVVVNNR